MKMGSAAGAEDTVVLGRRIDMSERKPYTTRARSVILDYLKRNWAVTVSAADIKHYLETEHISVNATTIYRFLDKLCEEHTVIKYPDVNSDKAVYQYAGEGSHCTEHLHLKCIRCGRVIHLDCGFMEELRGHLAKDHNFRLMCSGDLLHGVCGECDGGERRMDDEEKGEER